MYSTAAVRSSVSYWYFKVYSTVVFTVNFTVHTVQHGSTVPVVLSNSNIVLIGADEMEGVRI